MGGGGRQVTYYDVGANAKGRLTQLTFGESSDIEPSFARDGKSLYYSSNLGKDRIFNLYSLSLTDGEIRRVLAILLRFNFIK